MTQNLVPAEIDGPLTGPASGDTLPGLDGVAPSGVVRYNFRRPDRISKEQMEALHFLHERFARNVSQSLAAYFRSATLVSLVSVEQCTYSHVLQSLSDPTAFYALSMLPCDELGGLEINPTVAFAMVERMLGGEGKDAVVDRALTDIEQNVVDSVVKILLEVLSDTWRPVVDVTFGIEGRETRPQMLQVASPNDAMVLLAFHMRVGESQGALNMCLPASIVHKTGTHFVGARELVTMKVGDLLTLGVPTSRPLDMRVGKTLKFRGHPMVAAGRAGVTVAHRCDGAGTAEA